MRVNELDPTTPSATIQSSTPNTAEIQNGLIKKPNKNTQTTSVPRYQGRKSLFKHGRGDAIFFREQEVLEGGGCSLLM